MPVDKGKLDDLKIDRSNDVPSSRVPFKWIGIAIVVAAIVVAVVWIRRTDAMVVQVAAAKEVDAGAKTTVLNASGYVTARRAAVVSSKITGKVTEVNVEEGMEVHEGDLLAKLDDSIARAALRLYQAQADSARKSLDETRVQIAKAKLDFDRAKDLLAKGVASQADYDTAKANLDAFEAKLVTKKEDLTVAKRQVAVQQQNVDDTEIRAPFTGIVVTKDAQPGEMISPVSAGGGFTRTGICTIVDMSSLEIEVDVNEAYITRVKPGQAVEAVLDAYPDWKIPCHVITIIPTADRQKATVKVRIAFDHHDPRMLPDMGVKVSFIGTEGSVASARSTVTIPKNALRHDGNQDVVFVVTDGKVERRAVKVSATKGDIVDVVSGLSAGEQVVTVAPEGLTDGARVKVETKESA